MPKFYDHIDLRGNSLKNVLIEPSGSAPSSPSPGEGQIYYDTGDNALYHYNGSSWIRVADVNTFNALANGGLNETSQNFSLDFTNLVHLNAAPANADRVAVYDDDASAHKYVTYDDFISGLGGMTSFILEDGDGTEVTVNQGKEVKFVEGDGIDINWTNTSNGTDADPFDMTFTVNSTQSHITEIYNGDLKIGEDAQTQIDFTTDNNIIFDVDNVELAKLSTGTADFTVNNFNVTSSGSAAPILTIKNTNADSNGPQLKFAKDSASGADGDEMGRISFFGTDSSENTEQELAYINATINDAAHGSEAATMTFYVAENDATKTAGLQIVGQPDDDGEVDVTIAAGAASTTTVAGDLNVTTNFDVNGTSQFDGALTVGVDDTGHDVKFFGATSGKYMEWDESADQLDVTGRFDVTGNSTFTGEVTVGANNAGHDVRFWGASSNHSMLWDASQDQLEFQNDSAITFRSDTQYIKSNGVNDLTIAASDQLAITPGTLNLTPTTGDINISSSTSQKPLVKIENSNADSSSGELRFVKDSASGADSDRMGMISFYGTDSSENTEQQLAYIDAIINDSADGSEAATIRFYVAENDGTNTLGLQIIGQPDDDGEVDVVLGAGSGSTTTTAGSLAVTGDLTVQGTTTTVNSTTVTIDDPVFTLGGDTAPGSDDNKDRGIEFRYHDGSSARLGFFGWDDDATEFTGYTAATNSSEVFSGTRINANFGVGTFASLDVSGDVDVDGTLEADAITVNGTALGEYIEDTAGAMFSSNTETFITATYDDSDGTVDLVVPVKDEDNMASNSAAHLATQQSIKAYVDTYSDDYADDCTRYAYIDVSDGNFTSNKFAIITHNLSTINPIVQIWEMNDALGGSPTASENVNAKIECLNDAAVKVSFGSIPGQDLKVTIMKPGSTAAASVAYVGS